MFRRHSHRSKVADVEWMAAPRTRGQMRDRIELFPVKNISHRRDVAKIDMVNRHIFGNGGDVRALNQRIVKIVEIVQNRDFMSGGE